MAIDLLAQLRHPCSGFGRSRLRAVAGRGMSVGKNDNVGVQNGKRYQELENAGLRAGSPAALRVFN